MKPRANTLTIEWNICWTYSVGFTASNLPDRYLVHICPECSLGQAVLATSEEVNDWRLGVPQVPRHCPHCKTVDLEIRDVVERRNGRIA